MGAASGAGLDVAPVPSGRLVAIAQQDGPMVRPHLSTKRIDLVPMTLKHLPLLVELDADAEVLRHILGRARTTQEVHDYWGPICRDVEAGAVGLGWWVGWRRDDGDFLGWWDISPDQPIQEHPFRAEAGWRLRRQHWRRGYATEGARALLEHGFSTVGLRLVWAETMAVNVGSRAVMTKLGMRHTKTDHRVWDDPLPGAEQGEVVYEIDNTTWSAGAAGS